MAPISCPRKIHGKSTAGIMAKDTPAPTRFHGFLDDGEAQQKSDSTTVTVLRRSPGRHKSRSCAAKNEKANPTPG